MARYKHPSVWTPQLLGDVAPVQAAIMEIITDFKADPENDGNSPALADIAQALGKNRRRTGNIEKHIAGLIRKGLVRINDHSKIVLIGGRYLPPE